MIFWEKKFRIYFNNLILVHNLERISQIFNLLCRGVVFLRSRKAFLYFGYYTTLRNHPCFKKHAYLVSMTPKNADEMILTRINTHN